MDDRDTKLKVLWISIVAPPNQSENLTLLKCHEPLSHTRHELLHWTNKN
jgi:hypothetical protein